MTICILTYASRFMNAFVYISDLIPKEREILALSLAIGNTKKVIYSDHFRFPDLENPAQLPS